MGQYQPFLARGFRPVALDKKRSKPECESGPRLCGARANRYYWSFFFFEFYFLEGVATSEAAKLSAFDTCFAHIVV